MGFFNSIREYLVSRKQNRLSDEQHEINKKNVTNIHNSRCSAKPYTLFMIASLLIVIYIYWDKYLYYKLNFVPTKDAPYLLTFFSWIDFEYPFKVLFDTFFLFSIPAFIYWVCLYIAETYLMDQIFKYGVYKENRSYEEFVGFKKHIYTDSKSLEIRLARIKQWRKSWVVYIFIAIFCCFCVYYFAGASKILQLVVQGMEDFSYFLTCFLPTSFFLSVVSSFIYAVLLLSYEIPLENRLNAIRYDAASEVDGELVSQDIYSNSIKMSYKYLNQYYAQTRKQAENGFRITCIVAICGGVIIFGGIIAMFLGNAEPAYLTTATGVVIEFIASIFFYLYNKTMQNMGDYHNKLVLSQNIAIALEVVDDIEGEEKDRVKSEMVKELLKDINTHINENKPERKSDAIEHPKTEAATNTNINS